MFLMRIVIVMLALWLTGCSEMYENTLDNGLKIVVKEDHRSPVVVSQIWYKVGATSEPKGLSGISHVLEHMMFKGTTAHKAGEFSRIIAENGGRENAFTGRDYTAYFQQLEKSRLAVSFELEADRMHNLLLQGDEFGKEVQVVMEERRLRTDDEPEAQLYEKFMATAFKVHPYKDPIIGSMEDLRHLRVEDLRAWYQRWYVPNNATLVVVGDVRPGEVFALARKYFASIPRGKVEPVTIPAEPPQKELRRVSVSLPAEVPNLLMGYHVPQMTGQADEWEPYALQVLTGVLDGGDSARFSKELVRGAQIAAGIDTEYSPQAPFPGLLQFSATPANGHTVADVEKAVRAQIERIKNEPVSEAELQRVKAQVVAGDVYARDSVFYQAMRIGMLETIGLKWQLIDESVARIRRVTAEQVQQVAKKYLNEDNLTVGVLNPLPLSGGRKPVHAPLGGDNVR
jgi:zinc protease